jgi:hypothetical protein
MPGIQNLTLNTGGSFHGYKFMPNIGNVVVSVIREVLQESFSILSVDKSHSMLVDDELVERIKRKCRWERLPSTVSIHSSVVPETKE